MTVQIERSFEVETPIERVWELLSDDRRRAETISVVERFEGSDDGVVWHLSLPLPLVDRTVAVNTSEIERDPPEYVKFAGRSKVMDVTGEHELTETESGCTVRNRFVVEGKVPGVETFFERNIDDEIENIMTAVREIGADVEQREL